MSVSAASPFEEGAQDGSGEAARRAFAANLRALCARHRSISEVCRDLGINRQQFNKYLSGASFPSAHNFGRICSYFDVDGAGMLHPPRPDAVRASDSGSADLLFGPILQRMQQPSADALRKLERYVGFYHSYYCSPAYPGLVLKSASHFHRRDGLFFDKTLERLTIGEGRQRSVVVHRYTGAVIHTEDRIYILHQHMALHETLSMVAFYPSYAATPRMLSGVFVSVSSGPARQPFASRVVYEFHGRNPDLRRMLGNCGLHRPDSPQVGDEIRRRLDNHVDPDDSVLRALEY